MFRSVPENKRSGQRSKVSHKSEKIHKVWTKSLLGGTFTKSFASLVSLFKIFNVF